MRAIFFLLSVLIGCSDSSKSDDTQSNYECFLTITGTDNATEEVLALVESSYELVCSTENDKNDQMEDNCYISESNYTDDYTSLECDWECIETTTCN